MEEVTAQPYSMVKILHADLGYSGRYSWVKGRDIVRE
jgi:hypothetical protein